MVQGTVATFPQLCTLLSTRSVPSTHPRWHGTGGHAREEECVCAPPHPSKGVAATEAAHPTPRKLHRRAAVAGPQPWHCCRPAVVVNCTGLGATAPTIWPKDDALFPVRGQTLLVDAPCVPSLRWPHRAC